MYYNSSDFDDAADLEEEEEEAEGDDPNDADYVDDEGSNAPDEEKLEDDAEAVENDNNKVRIRKGPLVWLKLKQKRKQSHILL